MSFKIYHQLGHNKNWNLESFDEDKVGDGIILSPRHMAPKEIENVAKNLYSIAIFDPQFYMPGYAKGHLKDYEFFPANIVDTFETEDYLTDAAFRSALKCVEFQRKYKFEYVVIPTRFKEGLPSDFVDEQSSMFVEPFQIMLEGLQDRNVLLQIVLNEYMLKDWDYAADILNWVTQLGNIVGVYIVVAKSWTTKQMVDIELLFHYMRFIDALRANDLTVVLGYLNLESIVLSVADPHIIPIGSFEAARTFQVRKFAEEQGKQSSPTPRVFLPLLLQMVDIRYLGAIRRALPEDINLLANSPYQSIFDPTYRPSSNKPDTYKHNFIKLSELLREISSYQPEERYTFVRGLITDAQNWYNVLENGISFDVESSGNHLPLWDTALKQYAIYKGWR